jgi:hypothetical protein
MTVFQNSMKTENIMKLLQILNIHLPIAVAKKQLQFYCTSREGKKRHAVLQNKYSPEQMTANKTVNRPHLLGCQYKFKLITSSR